MPITEIVLTIFVVLILLFIGFHLLQRLKIIKGEYEDIEKLIAELNADDDTEVSQKTFPQKSELENTPQSELESPKENIIQQQTQEEQETTSPLPWPPEKVNVEDLNLHERAQRKARVIVREIEMYYKEKTEIGLREGNLYKYLKEEIERGLKTYIQSVPAHIRENTNYFEESLVTILAKGKKELLGGK
jgi:hypothetical protein